jgi:malonyl-CoA/methylmalonyl-CoA synthetase
MTRSPLDDPALRAAAVAAWSRHAGREVDPDALLAELSAGTLPEAFHATARERPDAPALWIDGVELTHGELDDRAARIGAWLREQGAGPAAPVLLSGPSSAAFVSAYLGVLRAGAPVVLASPALTAPELAHIAGDSGARIAIAPAAVLERLASGPPRLIDLDGPELAAPPAAPPAELPLDSGAPALIAYTSGTTGRPKPVPLTHANLLSSIRAVMLAWRWRADDVLVHALPLYHQHGLGGVHATLLAGSRSVIHAKLDPAAVYGSIAAERASVLFAVPAAYERLVGWDGLAGADLGSLRLLVSGSAPLSPALAERVAEAFGQMPLERYGSTEAGLDVSNPYDGPRKVGTVGLPLPGVEVAIVDGDGAPLPAGEDGEIVLRGPQVFAGYAGQPEATAESFFEGGWFRSGDIGRIDPEDGYLAITGRAKELIITGGLNVYPREVELALEEDPAVARAAVVGVPSERWGEEVVAFVVPEGDASIEPAALIAAARTRLAAYKAPKLVHVVTELPLNALGKIVRAELVEYATALAGYEGMAARAASRVGKALGEAGE